MLGATCMLFFKNSFLLTSSHTPSKMQRSLRVVYGISYFERSIDTITILTRPKQPITAHSSE